MTDVSTDTVIANIATVSAGGTNYLTSDTVTLSGGTGTEPTYTVASVGTSGAVTSLTLLSAGDLQTFPANPASFTGGNGTGLTADIYLAATPRSLANRAADNTNAKDFGAAVDGERSDTAAILLAYNAMPNNGILNIPAGGLLSAGFPSFSASFTGSISGTTLTVSSLSSTSGTTGGIGPGSILSGPGIPTKGPPPVVLSQLSGTLNGAGTYEINGTQSEPPGTILQANKSILIKTLGSLDYGSETPGTDPVTNLGDGNILETVYNGTKLISKTTTNNTNGFAALQVDYISNNGSAAFGTSSYVNSAISCNATSNSGTPAEGQTTGIWAITGSVNVNDNTNDNYGVAAICTVGTLSAGRGGAFYAQTMDQVGTLSTGTAEFDLFTFGDDPIPGGTVVDQGKRCMVLLALQLTDPNQKMYTCVQASRGIAVNSGSSTLSAIGAMFHGTGNTYYAVFNAANTALVGPVAAGLRLSRDMGIDFSTVAGDQTSPNNRVLIFNSGTGNLEYRVASKAPAVPIDAVFSITDEGTIIVTGAAIQQSSTGTFASGYRPNFNDQGNFTLVLTDNLTLANPLSGNATPGAQGYILLTQDGVGRRTISFGDQYVFAGGMAPTLSTAANAIDLLNYTVISSTQIAVALTNGLSHMP